MRVHHIKRPKLFCLKQRNGHPFPTIPTVTKSLLIEFNFFLGKDNLVVAPVLYLEEAFYVFGGCCGNSNDIGRLDNNNQWSRAGVLQEARHAHGAIFDGSHIMVMGGSGKFQTEKCTIQDGTISCVSQQPTLNNYWWYPELYLVSDTFCKN